MDTSNLVQYTNSFQQDDEWDDDGFEIPSLGIGDSEQGTTDVPAVEDFESSSIKGGKEENIYLGPHGAPPQQPKQQELNPSGRKQKFKQKLKEADQRINGSGRENKLENLRDLVGGEKTVVNMSKNSPRDWLDPHCHESEFEKHRVHELTKSALCCGNYGLVYRCESCNSPGYPVKNTCEVLDAAIDNLYKCDQFGTCVLEQ